MPGSAGKQARSVTHRTRSAPRRARESDAALSTCQSPRSELDPNTATLSAAQVARRLPFRRSLRLGQTSCLPVTFAGHRSLVPPGGIGDQAGPVTGARRHRSGPLGPGPLPSSAHDRALRRRLGRHGMGIGMGWDGMGWNRTRWDEMEWVLTGQTGMGKIDKINVKERDERRN